MGDERGKGEGSGLYLPEDGIGQLYGPDGKPVDSRVEEEKGPADDAPTVECDYCGSEEDKVRVRYRSSGRETWEMPEGWRELPNGLTECPDCRAVPDAETGEPTRPPEEIR